MPYFAQWATASGVRAIVEQRADPCDDPAWRDSGFESPEEYRFWARRICGLVCLASVLTHWEIDFPSRAELVRLALKWGAFRLVSADRVEGLTYRSFAEWVECDFGLPADVHGTLSLDDVPGLVDDTSFVIVSVSAEIRYPQRPNQRRGGHLVLVTGWDEDGIVFHNPSGVTPYQADAYVDWPTFERFYAGRGVALRRRTLGGGFRAGGRARSPHRSPG